MATRNLLIVGDSLVAEDNGHKNNWAWWNRLASDLNCESINLGITGASNFNIWHQIMYAKQHRDFQKAIVCLTRPNRIEKVLVDSYDNSDHETDFTDFTTDKIKSWAIHEWIEDGDYPLDVMEKFSPLPLAVSRDRIIVNDIVTQLSNYPSCIINNLFTEYTDNVEDISIRDYSDVITGQLDGPEAGHLHISKHVEFYDKHKDLLLAKLD